MTKSNVSQKASKLRLNSTAALITQTAIIITFLAASSAPTPLYRFYQEIWHFSPVLLTIIFSVYAFSLLAALLTAGALSDYIGRRPVIILALVLEIFAMVLFLHAANVEMLLIARVVQGAATGLAVAAVGAAILDLNKERGALINSISPMIGLALGALGACAILQFAATPLHLVFEFLLFILVIELSLIIFTEETVFKRKGALASLWPSMAVPPQARTTLLAVSPVNIAVWMLGGFYLSLMPSLLAKTFHSSSLWLSGITVAAVTLTGAVAIFYMRHHKPYHILLTGALSLTVGLLIIITGFNTAQTLFLMIGSVIAGIGFGTGFLGALRSVMPLALPEERAGLMATFYVESYLANSVPAIIAGYLVKHIGLLNTANLYGAVIILLTVTAIGFVLSRQPEESR